MPETIDNGKVMVRTTWAAMALTAGLTWHLSNEAASIRASNQVQAVQVEALRTEMGARFETVGARFDNFTREQDRQRADIASVQSALNAVLARQTDGDK